MQLKQNVPQLKKHNVVGEQYCLIKIMLRHMHIQLQENARELSGESCQ